MLATHNKASRANKHFRTQSQDDRMMEVEDQQIETIELATSKPQSSSRVIINRRF